MLLLGLLCSCSHSWAEDYEYLKSNYENFSQEAKIRAKENTKALGWTQVSISNEFKSYINYNYVNPKPYGITEVWIKHVVINDISKDGLGLGDYTMVMNQYNCSDKTYKNISYTDYSSKTGNVIDSYTYPSYSTQFKSVIPDTVGESQLNAVCLFSYMKSN